MTTTIGIDKMSFYTPNTYLDLANLAERDGTLLSKYHQGIGQERFSVPSHDEDIVTMAANAAATILTEADIATIDTILLATETGIDQSKAAAIYIHELLKLRPNCRAVELKQACYSATAALQLAAGYIARKPNTKVLLIASDISRYDLNTPAEATQGAAAVAMLISANPRLAILNEPSGIYTADVMDFWRPNHRNTPLVDGKLSTQIYLKASEAAYLDYLHQDGIPFAQLSQYCYHLPFSKMGQKAHERLCRLTHTEYNPETIQAGMIYNRQIGNSYTASLYLSLCSALDNRDDLADKHIGMMSYGSGCVAEYFSMTITTNYRDYRQQAQHKALLANRTALSLADYLHYWHRAEYILNEQLILPIENNGRYRLAAIKNYERRYEICNP